MAQIQDMWRKLNANERMAGTGAIIVIVAWLLGLLSSFGIGANILALIGGIVVLGIYYVKYSPSQSMTWPMPVPTIQVIVSAVVALSALVSLLQWLPAAGGLGVFGGFFLGAFIAVIATAVGAVLMVLGTWREYQAMPKTPPPPPPPTA